MASIYFKLNIFVADSFGKYKENDKSNDISVIIIIIIIIIIIGGNEHSPWTKGTRPTESQRKATTTTRSIIPPENGSQLKSVGLEFLQVLL